MKGEPDEVLLPLIPPQQCDDIDICYLLIEVAYGKVPLRAGWVGMLCKERASSAEVPSRGFMRGECVNGKLINENMKNDTKIKCFDSTREKHVKSNDMDQTSTNTNKITYEITYHQTLH